MKKSESVAFTELIVLFSIWGLFVYITFSSQGIMQLPLVLTWAVGYMTITSKIIKFVEWNFKPENYEIEKIEEID